MNLYRDHRELFEQLEAGPDHIYDVVQAAMAQAEAQGKSQAEIDAIGRATLTDLKTREYEAWQKSFREDFGD